MNTKTKIKVRYVETDQMGVVHHSNYFHWFEVGRTEFLNQLGMSYGEIEKQGVMFPLIETHCYYKLGAKYEDELIVTTKLSQINGVKVYFSYEVIREKDDKLIAYGDTVHVFTNRSLRPINIKKESSKIYNMLFKVIEVK